MSPVDIINVANDPRFAWLSATPIQHIISTLDPDARGIARCVGGCVRDSLFDEVPHDIDIAVARTPQEVMSLFDAGGISYAPTGVEYGTITAIVDGHGFEVTSLRSDISTDGRRADVAYTADWRKDAARRDFSMNALYLSLDGSLFDPTGGINAIDRRAVEFIGEPSARIQEDYLRILRFFRFTARFGDRFDEAGLAACDALKDGMQILSRERIGAEFMKILALPRVSFALIKMHDTGVLREVVGDGYQISAVARLTEPAQANSAPIRLAALLELDQVSRVTSGLRLSNAERAIIVKAAEKAALFSNDDNERTLKEKIYRMGRAGFCDGLAVSYAKNYITLQTYIAAFDLCERWVAPPLPFSGKDVLTYDIEPGPIVSQILTGFEDAWIEADYPDGAEAQAILHRIVGTVSG